MTGLFDWQVAVDPYLGWSAFQNNRLIFRVDLDDGDVLSPLAFSADWPIVSGLVSQNGIIDSTGWQAGTFTINTPPAGDPQPLGVSFMTFGYDDDQWWSLVDNVDWELQ